MAAGDVVASVKKNNGRRCATFDGVNDVLSITADTFLNYGITESFSIAMWFKSARVGAADTNLIHKSTGATSWFLSIKTSRKIEWFMSSTGTTLILGGTTVDDDLWHHVVCVRDVSTDKVYLYVDSVSDASSVTDGTTGTCPVSACDLRIGNYPGNNFMNGEVADVRMYRTALTQAEINTIYAGGNVTRGLQNVWNFNDGTYNDSVGNKNLTNSGTSVAMIDDTIATQIKTMRITKNDKWMLAEVENGQVILANVEEAP